METRYRGPAPGKAGTEGEGLTQRALSASAWQFGSLVVQAALQLGVLALLSRLVSPAEFGTVGVAMIFVGFVNLLADVGIGPALVQRHDLNSHHVRTGFTLTLLAGTCLTVGIWASAPLWARVFENLAVEPILRLLSGTVLIASVGIVASALLRRRLAFKHLGLAEVAGYAIGYGVVGLVLAARGHGVWSLAWAVVAQNAVRTTCLLAFVRHSLLPSIRLREAREILGYGVGMGMTRVFNYAATRGDYVVVGRWLGAAMLGLYERAYKLIELPSEYVAGAIDKVLFPAMSEIQRDRARLRRIYLSGLGLIAFIYLPLSVVMVYVAPHVVVLLFGNAWSGATLPLQIMSVGLLFRASYKISDSLIRALGAVYGSAWRVFIYALLVVGGALVGQKYGIAGVSVAIVFAIGAKFFMVSQLALSLLDLTWKDFARVHRAGGLVAATLLATLMGSWHLVRGAGIPLWSELLVLLAAATGTVIAVLAAAPSAWLGREYFWALDLIHERVPHGRRLTRWVTARRTGYAPPKL